MVSDSGSFRDRARDAVPNSLVVPAETVVKSGVKLESEVEQRPDAVRIRDATQRGGGNGQSGGFAFKHGIEPSDDINALSRVVGQPLSVQVRERGEENNTSRRKSKLT
jgi:hypothetical protein